MKVIGIYFIKCLINKYVYIGSTINTKERFQKHLSLLKHNKHPNNYLQNSYNKYGFENFKIGIITICEQEELLKNEQFYINNNKLLFNVVIEDVIRPTLSKEVRNRISIKLKEKYKDGNFRINSGNFKKGLSPWNKGKKYNSTEHLKVPKLKIADKTKCKETKRIKMSEIFVYDSDMNFLGKWRSSKDLQEWSLTKENNLPIKSRFKGESRMGIPLKELQSVNINKSCNFGKKYKNLYFKYRAHVKLEELLETPIINNEDNQQPS